MEQSEQLSIGHPAAVDKIGNHGEGSCLDYSQQSRVIYAPFCGCNNKFQPTSYSNTVMKKLQI